MICGSHIKIWNLSNHMKNKTKNIKMLDLFITNWKIRVGCSLFHFFHMICKISNFNIWSIWRKLLGLNWLYKTTTRKWIRYNIDWMKFGFQPQEDLPFSRSKKFQFWISSPIMIKLTFCPLILTQVSIKFHDMTSLDATPTLAKKAVNSQWYEELKKTFDEGYSWVSFNLLQSVQSCGRRQLCTYEKCYLQQLRY